MENELILKFPENAKNLKIAVEAGHIYTNESPGIEHKISAVWGSKIAHLLNLRGAKTSNWVFIDNYNPSFEGKPQTLDSAGYLCLLESWGFKPGIAVYEADLAGSAKEAIAYLKSKSYASEISGKTVLCKDKILLYDHEKEKCMCSLLDACLYMEKLKHADACATVLDEQYRSQQKATKTILSKLGADPQMIFPFFYSLPCSNKHSSVGIENIYAAGSKDASSIQHTIDLLQIVSKLSGSVSVMPYPDIGGEAENGF